MKQLIFLLLLGHLNTFSQTSFIDTLQNQPIFIDSIKESFVDYNLLTSEEIKLLPFRNYIELFTAIPGFTFKERNFIPDYRRDHFNNPIINIDGFMINDFQGNIPFNISRNRINSIQLYPIQRDIIYSNFSTGALNIITQPTRKTYTGGFEYVTDNVLFDGFKGLRSTGTEITDIWVSGPIIPTKPDLLQFYGSIEYYYARDSYRSFNSEDLRNISNTIWKDFQFYTTNWIRSLTRLPQFSKEEIGSPEYQAAVSKYILEESRWNKVRPGQIPDAAQLSYSWNEKITLNLNNIKLTLSGISSRDKSRLLIPSFLLMNSFNNPLIKTNSDLYYSKLQWQITSETNLDFGISYSNYYKENSHPIFGKRYFDYGDLSKNPLIFNYYNMPYPGNSAPFDGYLGYFVLPGRIHTLLYYHRFETLQLKSDLTTSISNHKLQFGAEFKSHKLRKYQINPLGLAWLPDSLKQIILINPDYLNSNELNYIYRQFSFSGLNTYGYDIFGRELNYNRYDTLKRAEGPKKPLYGGLYFNDLITFDSYTLSFGIRMNIWDLNDYRFKDIYDITNSKNTQLYGTPERFKELFPGKPVPADGWGNPNTIEDDSFKKTKPQITLNPRFGIAFNLQKNTVLSINYSVYSYMPEYDFVYISRDYIIHHKDAYIAHQDPGIKPLIMYQYEIGINKITEKNYNIFIKAFHKKNIRQLEQRLIESEFNKITSYFNLNSYRSEVLGLDFIIISPVLYNLKYSFNYSYSYKMLSGIKSKFYDDYYDQHSLLVNLIYDYKPLTLNLIYRAMKGKNLLIEMPQYGWIFDYIKIDDWKYQLDAKISYNYNIWKNYNVSTYVEIQNVFNIKNSYYKNKLLPGQDIDFIVRNLTQQGRLDELAIVLGLYDMKQNPVSFVGMPRNIRLGLLFEF